MWQEQAYYIATHSYDVEPMAVNRKRLTQCHHPKFSRLKPFDIKKTNKQTNKQTHPRVTRPSKLRNTGYKRPSAWRVCVRVVVGEPNWRAV